jgi:hypothetical protein
MGVIVSFIDSEFNLNYRLIGFEDLTIHHTGIQGWKLVRLSLVLVVLRLD